MAKGEFVPVPKLINNAALGAAGVETAYLAIGSRKTVALGLQANQGSGNLTATVVVAVSFDYIDPGNGDPAGVTAAGARATWFVITSGLTAPAGAATDSTVFLTLACMGLRVVITRTAGSGPVRVDAGCLNV